MVLIVKRVCALGCGFWCVCVAVAAGANGATLGRADGAVERRRAVQAEGRAGAWVRLLVEGGRRQ